MAKRRGLFQNPLSYVGALILAGGVALIIAFVAMQFSLGPPSPYLGIFAFLVFPAVALLGGLLIVAGMILESRRRRRLGPEAPPVYPAIDLNDPRQRRRVGWIVTGGLLGAMLLVYVAYNAFLFTESVTFCGEICHKVMEPEYVTYQSSPHAQVTCVQCHIGHGVDWYVKSKVSGLRQVFAVAFNSYERPIRVPTSDLRPARGTCEECHWPGHFLGSLLTRDTQYGFDEGNTPTQLTFLVNVGGEAGVEGDQTVPVEPGNSDENGAGQALPARSGVHWHIASGVEVTYAALDDSLQVIPWMRVTRPDGSADEYFAEELTPEQIAGLPRRTMDCMDCHNRPSHQLGNPDDDLDSALDSGRISRSLPRIKEAAFVALVADYSSKEEGLAAIEQSLRAFYAESYPQVPAESGSALEQAIATVQGIYETSVFPFMEADYGTYPQHATHKNWPGCFRCHDAQHERSDGQTVSAECTLCHTFPERLVRQADGSFSRPASELNWHIWPLEERHAEIRCDRCHDPRRLMRPDCAACHQISTEAPHIGTIGCAGCHIEGARARPRAECESCHGNLTGLHRNEGHQLVSCNTCHPPHVWEPEGRDTCLTCHSRMDTPASLPANLRVFHQDRTRICYNCHLFMGDTGPLGFPRGQ